MGATNSILSKRSKEKATNSPAGASDDVDEANKNNGTTTKIIEKNIDDDDKSCSTIVVSWQSPFMG